MDSLSLLELNALVRRSLEQCCLMNIGYRLN